MSNVSLAKTNNNKRRNQEVVYKFTLMTSD